jgi:hypothetical protein
LFVIKHEFIILCDDYPVMVGLDKIFEYLQNLCLIIILNKALTLSFHVASSKSVYVNESNAIKDACSDQSKRAIISTDSTKNAKAIIDIA